MNNLAISWKSLRLNPLSALLNILLIAFGISILTILVLASEQISDKLTKNSKDIDLVVGAKGSPLQLILSSIFYIDFPTGNIPLKEAEQLARNPLVKRAVPLALGDNYEGFRIAGTDTSFIHLYDLTLSKGRFWQHDFEVTVGSAVAAAKHLQPGSTFYGAHGLTGTTDEHKAHTYRVVGVLAPKGDVTDNLVMTSIASVWKMHDHEEKTPEQEKAAYERGEREITSLLIQYRSPMSVIIFPRMVNQSTTLQAASPALESARLFSLIGVGVDTLQAFAFLIMTIAAISVFISLYNSLKERKYDLAVMRTLGASRSRLLVIVILEGLILTMIGAVVGLAMGHLTIHLIGHYQSSDQARLSGAHFVVTEWYLLAAGVVIGIVASIIPAIQAYKSDISKILSHA